MTESRLPKGQTSAETVEPVEDPEPLVLAPPDEPDDDDVEAV